MTVVPIYVQLKPGATPVQLHQYPIKQALAEGLCKTLYDLQDAGVLGEVQSPWNTPILPVSKKDGTVRLVHDLKEVNAAIQDLPQLVPDPYLLLSSLGLERAWFTVLDLKDAFFCIPIDEPSSQIFAFTWKDASEDAPYLLRLEASSTGMEKFPCVVLAGPG